MSDRFRARRNSDKLMMRICSIAAMILWALVAAGAVGYVVAVARRVTYVTLADGRRTERTIPLLYRVLLPLAPNFRGLLRHPAFSELIKRSERRLVQGGFEGLVSAEEFVALKFMLFWVLPEMWLSRAIVKRHLSIQRSLPFVLDLLTLSVEAGMDFISALQRNCKSRRLDPLNEELLRMTKEIQIGLSRKEALADMAERVQQTDLKSVAFALIQADELGVSVGAILRIQSEQMRSKRFDRAERLAAQAPVKMLGPLMLFIFPAVFIILLGPILMQAMKGLY